MKILSKEIMSTEQVESETDYVLCKVNKHGDKRYYNAEDQLHREDGPAVEWSDGSKEWWLKGKLHREDGPAVEYSYGYKSWYLNGKRHREDGPAIECADGDKFWYLNDKRHREDGPAIEYTNGDKHWFINGKKVTKKTVRKLGKMKGCESMRKNAKEVLIAFSQGKAKSGSTIRTDGKSVFSYEMKIAERLDDGRVWVVDIGESPSRTTSSHIRACMVEFPGCHSY